MKFTPTDTLKNDLAELYTEITEISDIEDSFITPKGEVYQGLGKMTRIALLSTPTESSHINHEIVLPENWNGRFLGTGNGGMAGRINYSGLFRHAEKGYAVINTDMGSSGGRGCGFNNPEILKDFGWRSTYIMTRVGKIVTEAFYGRRIEKSYFWGGSTGGQQSLMLAQRYPEEYEGIIAGVPANNRVNLHIGVLWARNTLKSLSRPFEESELFEITASAVEYSKKMGTSDPEDLFVSAPRGDKEYIDGFIEYLRQGLKWITEEQLAALHKIYTGPTDSRTGARIYNGYPIGSESRKGSFYSLQSSIIPKYTFAWAFGADYTGMDFDFGDDVDRMHAALSELPANDPRLTPFFERGGKLFMYSGSADPVVPFPDAMKYYDRVAKAVGGMDAALKGARYFLVPGQDHSAAVTKYGPALLNGQIEVSDSLDILRIWCEEGIAPESFDTVTEINGVRIPKRIYAYGTKNNPSRDYPTCDERYM